MADNSPKKERAPKGIRVLIRVWGTLSALCIGITGLFVMITLSATCLVTGILQLVVGLIILPLEAPILCANFPTLVSASDWFENHLKFWMRAALYLIFALPPFFLCPELSTFIGGAAVLVTAALYGVLAIGKKGSEAPKSPEETEMRTQLVKNGEPNEESGM
ncbi:calcium channel flower-like [Rhopilema esculentum]|uniref:calcium channel flower-like n=1 Tax=Rhopilema esculentum TaxID=499914 RepID=UPI0031CEB264